MTFRRPAKRIRLMSEISHKYAAALGPVQDADAPADITSPPSPQRIVEALLFAGGQPLTAERAAAAVRNLPADEFHPAIHTLARAYRRPNRPYSIQATLSACG